MKELLIQELTRAGEALAWELTRRGLYRIYDLGCEEGVVWGPSLWDRGNVLDCPLQPLMALAYPGPPVDEIADTWDTMVSELGRGVTVPDCIARLSLLYPNFSFRSPEGHPTDHRVQMVQLLGLAALEHGTLRVEAQQKVVWYHYLDVRGIHSRMVYWGSGQKRHPKNMAISPYKVITARKAVAVTGRLATLAEHLVYALPDMAREIGVFISLVKMAGPVAITKVCNHFEILNAKVPSSLQPHLTVLRALRNNAEYPHDLIHRTYCGSLPLDQLFTLTRKPENDSPYVRDPQIRIIRNVVSRGVAAAKRSLRDQDAESAKLISYIAG